MSAETKIDKDNWVRLFTEAGLSEETMLKWHTLFEREYPESHRSFLQWLGLADPEITDIRKRFQS